MGKSIKDIQKRGPGRPYTGGRKPPHLVRMDDALTATIDDWRKMQDDQPSRPEAIRRLVELGLKAKAK